MGSDNREISEVVQSSPKERKELKNEDNGTLENAQRILEQERLDMEAGYRVRLLSGT